MPEKINPNALEPGTLALLLTNARQRLVTEKQVRTIAEAGNLLSAGDTINLHSIYRVFGNKQRARPMNNKINPQSLKPAALMRLLNTAGFGMVLTEHRLRRHRNRAGFAIGTESVQSIHREANFTQRRANFACQGDNFPCRGGNVPHRRGNFPCQGCNVSLPERK